MRNVSKTGTDAIRAARAALLLWTLLVAGGPDRVRAQSGGGGHTYFCQVAQPMVARDDRRIEIHDVTYALKLQSPVPGVEVKYTCFPGPVVIRGASVSDTVNANDIANLNAANLLGLSLRVESRPAGSWNVELDSTQAATGGAGKKSRFFVDELKVDLDVGGLMKQRRHASEVRANREELSQFDALVAATVECILDNARRSQPPVRKIRLNVVGWDRYRHMTDVYHVKQASEKKRYTY